MNLKAEIMEPEKNLHAFIPSALLSELEKTAQAEHVTLDELMRQAAERFIEDRRWKNLYAFGEQQARKLDIKEDDVERIIQPAPRESARAKRTRALSAKRHC